MQIFENKIEHWNEYVKKNNSSYGKAAIDFAIKWANLMEIEIFENGKVLAEIANETCNKADTEGITGNMYSFAVKMLSECWIKGNELKAWHNKKFNYEDDSVVNSAVITIHA